MPSLVYGNTPPPLASSTVTTNTLPTISSGTLQGIGASNGCVEGTICVLEALPESAIDINAQTILVVPYTDAGWSPLLARIGGPDCGSGRANSLMVQLLRVNMAFLLLWTLATQPIGSKRASGYGLTGQRGTIEILSIPCKQLGDRPNQP